MRTATCLGLALLLAAGVVGTPAADAEPADAEPTAAQAAAPESLAPESLAMTAASPPRRPVLPEPASSARQAPPAPISPDEDDAPEDEAADDVIVREVEDGEDEVEGSEDANRAGREDTGREGDGREGDGRDGHEDDGREDRRVDRNVVVVINRADDRMRVRGRIKLVRDRDTHVEPVNGALAFSSCTDCQTFAVALEIVLVRPDATYVVPRNEARAINYECTRCVTVARALQYVYTVDDPNEVPENLRALLRDMEKELREIGRDKSIGAAEANARINGVVERFRELADGLNDRLDEATVTTSPDASPAGPTAPSPEPAPDQDPTGPTDPAPDPSPAPSPEPAEG